MRIREKLLLTGAAGLGALWGWRGIRRSRRRIDLRDRVVLVTGASSGHGLVLARLAAAEGAHLVIAARSAERLGEAELDLLDAGAASVLAVPTDVSDESQAHALVERTINRHGRVDVLLNDAGIIRVGPVSSMTLQDFREVMDTNFWGSVYTTLAVLPYMRRQRFGRIGNVVSLGGKRTVPHMLPYSASKFALSGFTEGLRSEVVKDDIFVTGLYPATMRTGSHRNAEFKGDAEAEYAWFATTATAPGLATAAETVARKFLRAVCDGEAEVIVGLSSYLAVAFHGLLPNENAELDALATQFLLPQWDGGPTASVKGEDLRGNYARLLNQVVPEGTRPSTGPEMGHQVG